MPVPGLPLPATLKFVVLFWFAGFALESVLIPWLQAPSMLENLGNSITYNELFCTFAFFFSYSQIIRLTRGKSTAVSLLRISLFVDILYDVRNMLEAEAFVYELFLSITVALDVLCLFLLSTEPSKRWVVHRRVTERETGARPRWLLMLTLNVLLFIFICMNFTCYIVLNRVQPNQL